MSLVLPILSWSTFSWGYTPSDQAIYSDNQIWVDSVFGKKFPQASINQKTFTDWIKDPTALITAEQAHLGLQITLERVREYLDPIAYDLFKSFYQALNEKLKAVPPATPADFAWQRLIHFLHPFVEQRFDSAQSLSGDCQRAFDNLTDKAKQELAFLFGGLIKKDSELFWKKLKAESCDFQGYVANSIRPEIWKFWMAYRILGLILPKDSDSAAFVKSLENLDEKALESLSKLETYMSLVGKPNGLSLKAALTAKKTECKPRTGGRFKGSSAISLLSDHSVAWKDSLSSRFTLEKLWEDKTKAEISLEPIFTSLPTTYKQPDNSDPSAFDIGLVFCSKNMREFSSSLLGKNRDYYSKSLNLQWIMGQLNGFSNLSNWKEALRWDIDTQVPAKDISANIFGSPNTFALLGHEYDSAMKTMEPLIEIARKKQETTWLKIQSGWLNGFTKFKNAAIRVTAGKVEKLSKETMEWWARFQFSPDIATIGVYALDKAKYPAAPEAASLHLASNNEGYLLEIEIDKKPYLLWGPALYKVLYYSSTPLSTQEWEDLVQKAGF